MANKKIKAATLLAATLTLGVFSLAACQDSETPSTDNEAPTTEPTKTPSTGGDESTPSTDDATSNPSAGGETTPSTDPTTAPSSGESSESTDKPVAPAKKTVTFMVPNKDNLSELKKFDTKEVDAEGRLQMPQDPKMEGYTFRGWYLDKEYTTKFEITGYEFTESLTLYGLFVEDTVTVHIINAKGEDTVIDDSGVPNLEALEAAQNTEAAKSNLVFDGWYTNAQCTTPYTPESEAIEIYGRYMAQVTFNNGYEDVAVKLVKPGEAVEMPTVDEVTKDRSYMSKEDIFFVDADGKDYDSKSKISANTSIRVLWKSPFLDFKKVELSNNYYCNGFDISHMTTDEKKAMAALPIVSIPSRITINGEICKVVSLYGSNVTEAKSAKVLIVNEGIESIYSFNDTMSKSSYEEVYTPTTLRFINSAFTGFKSLAKVELHEGLEAIFDSFWSDYSMMNQSAKSKAYDFITIPASVNNMAEVPTDLKFAEGSKFSANGGMLFKDDEALGKVLVSVDPSAIINGTLTVPEGVDAIQVGTLDYRTQIKNLILPESFNAVSYNNDINDYSGLFGTGRFTDLSSVKPGTNPGANGADLKSYTILSRIKSLEYITFNTTGYPETLNEFAFTNDRTSFTAIPEIHLIFVKDVTEGNVTINVNVKAPKLDIDEVVSFEIPTNTTLTEEEFLIKSDVTFDNVGVEIVVNYIRQFGIDVDFSKPITSNQYIEVEFEPKATGFKYTTNEDGTLTVTGFDAATAEKLDTGGYSVNIPAKHEGKVVSAIAEGAFENCDSIVSVYIGANVKSIGARAFKNTKNLNLVDIKQGALEFVGEEAFMYACSVQDEEGNWIANPAYNKVEDGKLVTRSALSITMPLGNMKEIQANAFNSPAIREFKQTAEEEGNYPTMVGFSMFPLSNKKEGMFMYQSDGTNINYSIIKITKLGTTPNKNGRYENEGEYVATAGGARGCDLALGKLEGSYGRQEFFKVVVKRGSVALYEDTFEHISFGCISKVEAGAFSYINPKLLEVKVDGTEKKSIAAHMDKNGSVVKNIDEFLTEEQVKTIDPEIFEEGWMVGVDDATLKEFMSASHITGVYPGQNNFIVK